MSVKTRKKRIKAAANASNEVTQMRSRLAAFMGYSHSGNRDLYEVFGYPRDVRTEELFTMYFRNDIANRIIRAFPAATWRDKPIVRDEAGSSSEKEGKDYSPFVDAVEQLFERMHILSILERADRLSTIGRFGTLMLGFQDGAQLSLPLDTARKSKLLYLQPYSELGSLISQWETNTQSERYCKPSRYTLNRTPIESGAVNPVPASSLAVHHSRVLHLAEVVDQDEVYGVPRLMPIYNRLKDLEKVVGGNAETFWLNANRGLALFADKESVLGDEDKDAIRSQADEFQHQLRRVLVGQGMTAQVLGSDVADCGPVATVLLDLIAGTAGIPKRILMGSERGELASSQDENNWATRIYERRENYVTPFILRPLVNLLISTGNLPQPKGQWWVEWPQDGLSENALADLAIKKTQALTTYANSPGAELIMPKQEFRKDILGLSPDSEYEPSAEEPLPEDDAANPFMLKDKNPQQEGALEKNYDDNQPRDGEGQWSESGAGIGGGAPSSKKKKSSTATGVALREGVKKPKSKKALRDPNSYAEEGDSSLTGNNSGKGAADLANKSLSSPLTDIEKESISEYAKSGHFYNKQLRAGNDKFEYKGIDGKTGTWDRSVEALKHLDNSFARASLARNVDAYRVVDNDFYSELEKHVGGTFTDKAFVSTTASTAYAEAYAQDFMMLKGETIKGVKRVTVKMPRGSKALPIAHVDKGWEKQSEVLINRGSSFSVSRGNDGGIILTLKG